MNHAIQSALQGVNSRKRFGEKERELPDNHYTFGKELKGISLT